MIEGFKGRSVDFNLPVEVYRCLNRKGRIFSIRQNGLVVAHGNNFTLRNVEFVIRELSKRKVIYKRERQVHAWAKGFIEDTLTLAFGINLYYDPFSVGGFYIFFNESKTFIDKWKTVSFNSDGVFLNP